MRILRRIILAISICNLLLCCSCKYVENNTTSRITTTTTFNSTTSSSLAMDSTSTTSLTTTVSATQSIQSLTTSTHSTAGTTISTATSTTATKQTTKKTTTKTTKSKEIIMQERIARVVKEASSRKSYGRLYIDSVGVDVALIEPYVDNKTAQQVCDDKDSACIFNWYEDNVCIGDHVNQGFWRIKNCKVGTRFIIVCKDMIDKYECKAIIRDGWNDGMLRFNDRTPLHEKYSDKMILYTCNSDGTITVLICEKVSREYIN